MALAARSGSCCHGCMVAGELHVVPDPRSGGWLVDGRWFATAHEAQEEARRRAFERGLVRIWLHDRYHRVHLL
jgi:hypothetical protein